MASGAQEIRAIRTCRAATESTTVPVILDCGDRATVAAVDLPCRPFVGLRFERGGVLWEITHAKDPLRGWVAEPVETQTRAAS